MGGTLKTTLYHLKASLLFPFSLKGSAMSLTGNENCYKYNGQIYGLISSWNR
ncbi:hypothetical protein [Moorena producens]|uniref:hypothetical protein n=1 Tax=Moorena producens TaxID=1155739 RepID=UPI003C70E749